MDKSLKVNEIKLEKGDITIPMFDYDDIDCKKKNLVKGKLSYAEWKSLIFGWYKNKKGGFLMRDSIIVKGTTNDHLKIGDEVLIKDGARRILGSGTIKFLDKVGEDYQLTLNNLKVMVNGEKTNNIKDLFKWEKKEKDDKEKDIYLNKMYRMSYNAIYYYFKHFFYEENKSEDRKTKYLIPSNKFSAYCSYLSVKEVLEDQKYIVSQLDSFIDGFRWEYDALLLKNKKNINGRLFNRNDVLATIEIKTSGYYCKSKNNINKNFKEYMKKEKIKGIPHIYLAINESESCNYYTKTYNVIKELENEEPNEVYIPLFCKKQINTDYITIPEEYDLDEILRAIKIN